MKLLVAALSVLLFAAPVFGTVTVNADGVIRDPAGAPLPFTLSIESETDDACKYNANTGAPPDTLTTGEPDKVYLLFGPSKVPTNLVVSWQTEANVTFGFVQFKERALDSDAYTWGETARMNIALLANTSPTLDHEFKVGLWESVRVWAQGSAGGLLSISAYANVLE